MLRAASLAAVLSAADTRPNFNGVWKLSGGGQPEFLIVGQTANELRLARFVRDRGDSAGPFALAWDRDALLVQFRPHEQWRMKLAARGRELSIERGAVRERWFRQDPLPGEIKPTGFDRRRSAEAATGLYAQRARCSVADAFNDVALAERECIPLLQSRFRSDAREHLAAVYWRNDMFRKAAPYFPFLERAFFYGKMAKRPELAVARRAPGRIRITRDSEGHILLPVVAAGKEASYIMDTGANMSALRMSEARRLGLRPQSPRVRMVNGLTKLTVPLVILPALEIGGTRLENVPFWAIPDDRLEWCAGMIGIDVLLKLETIRWDANEAEIGFPAQRKEIPSANLCFRDGDMFTDGSAYGQDGLALFFDTGSPDTALYPRFAALALDLLSANGKPPADPYAWTAFGKRAEFYSLAVPELTLRVGGAELALRPGGVLLDRRPGHIDRHGIVGADLLNLARRVTLDLRAMRLTLE